MCALSSIAQSDAAKRERLKGRCTNSNGSSLGDHSLRALAEGSCLIMEGSSVHTNARVTPYLCKIRGGGNLLRHQDF